MQISDVEKDNSLMLTWLTPVVTLLVYGVGAFCMDFCFIIPIVASLAYMHDSLPGDVMQHSIGVCYKQGKGISVRMCVSAPRQLAGI